VLSALWWRLGEQVLNEEAEAWGARKDIGVSGAGKTRTMYEMLARNFGFYWTCSCAGNDGADIVKEQLAPLIVPDLGESQRDINIVRRLVRFLICAYSILLLQWRRKYPDGSALDWLVFQTAADVNGAPLRQISRFLRSSVQSGRFAVDLLDAATDSVSVGGLRLVVDEAQVLAQVGVFKSANVVHSAEKRRLLSPFAQYCANAGFHSVWFAGTRMSLRVASDVFESSDGKKRRASLVECKMVFEEETPFQQYLTEMVGVEFSAPLIAELHARFKGRARRVAVLAEYLIADGVAAVVADAEEFHERVMDVAFKCESDLLSPTMELGVSIVRNFIDRQETDVERTERMPMWVKIAMHAFGGAAICVREEVDYWFDIGVGKLRHEGTLISVEVFEPLTAKMLLCAALDVDKDGARGLNPVLAPMLEMSFTKNESARGFLAEVFVIPVIHRFLARSLGYDGGLRNFFAVPHADLVDGVRRGLHVFMPEAKAGPDAVHTFALTGAKSHGALGQVKFRAKLSKADWAHAVRTVDRGQLYSEKENLTTARNTASAVLDAHWPNGSCSYIFTICEPPVRVPQCEQTLADGRKLFVFSPLLCPTLFAADVPDIDVWQRLKEIKFQ
jgi:hypothetical protein